MLLILIFLDKKRWLLWLVVLAMINVFFFWAIGFDGLRA